jgi:phosphoribosylanthranilate isomerase
MKIKVCGMRQEQNVDDIGVLEIDYAGFIFVEASPRNVDYSSALMKSMNRLTCKKVGVFVNAPTYFIKAKSELFNLNAVQLHGDEADYQIEELAKVYEVFKAFSVDENFDFNIQKYGAASYFLFDTKGKKRGGNGIKFNWEMLQNYKGEVPFFLSGGIGPVDVEEILKINHPKFAGIDVNSGFEERPGLKKVEELKQFILDLNAKVKEV